ncbi:MAG: sigma-54 interaction domain-containing protein [Cytophagaceae bacterium]
MNLTAEIQSVKQRFGIIGNAPALNHAIQVAIQVAPTDMTVLITGESGSGKESFSKIIHHLSSRKHGQFIAINCGAIPEGTIDSELFGHEKGSFTGAHEARKGYFEVTNGGTIFLDEIGEMPLGTQARLLRVLENGEFIKVGSSKVLKTDVRVVAATNVDLFQAVEKGKFREDLYYRLNTVPIYVPPLRERGSDIELLFRKFATDFADKYRVQPIKLSEEAKAELLKFRFPGNIRQLKNIVEQISVLETNREISKEQLTKYLPEPRSGVPAIYREQNKSDDMSERDILYKILFEMKKDMNELKQLVFNLLQDDHYGNKIIKEHQRLFDGFSTLEEEFTHRDDAEAPFLIHKSEPVKEKQKPIDYHKIQDVEQEPEEEESLSLEEKEKEMIVKALRKNNNKRKYAAQDLGISERTLYRKIKQYSIEE